MNIFGKKIIAGEYLINNGDSCYEIFNKITSGKIITRIVTIPEGLTISQTIELLNNQYGIINDIEGTDLYQEGEFLPNTYKYMYGTNISYLLKKMNKALLTLLQSEWETRDVPNTQELKNSYDALILASIVEKETSLKDEKALIARVYLNRLKKNMPLQADPTVIYGISKWKNFNRNVTYNDLKIKSLYNTYKHIGLPPTPICNPGKLSINAVLHPKKTDSLYFVANNLGQHIFSKNYKEHLKNIQKVKSFNQKLN